MPGALGGAVTTAGSGAAAGRASTAPLDGATPPPPGTRSDTPARQQAAPELRHLIRTITKETKLIGVFSFLFFFFSLFPKLKVPTHVVPRSASSFSLTSDLEMRGSRASSCSCPPGDASVSRGYLGSPGRMVDRPSWRTSLRLSTAYGAGKGGQSGIVAGAGLPT